MINNNKNSIEWKFYLNSFDAWEVMLEDCQNAKETIDIEQFIFEYDEIGKKFAEVFERKIEEGVKVRMLLDMAGSFVFYNSAISKNLIKKGVEIEWHNIIKPWRMRNVSSWFFRDHRKILIIDSQIGHIGGVGIEKRMAFWRDSHVRLISPIIYEMQESFNKIWEKAKGGRYIKSERPRYFIKGFQFLTNSPKYHQRFIYHNLIEEIRNAKKRIYLTAPYFIPDLRLLRVLRLAAKRGVDVKIITPKISDHPFIDSASESYYWLVLKSGVKIYKYRHYFLHAKTAIIDDNWSSVGSANLDNLSLLFNYEANLVSSNHLFAQELLEHFEKDLKECNEIKIEQWKKRSMFKRFRELITWPFHKFF